MDPETNPNSEFAMPTPETGSGSTEKNWEPETSQAETGAGGGSVGATDSPQEELLSQIKESLEANYNLLSKILNQLEGRKVLEESERQAVNEAIVRLTDLTTGLNSTIQAFSRYFEMEIPEALRLPTPEMFISPDEVDEITRGLKTEDARRPLYRDSRYQEGVKGWFLKLIEEIDTSGLPFEQHPNFPYLHRGLSELERRRETIPLAREIKEILNSRRKFRTMVVVWNNATPDQLVSNLTLEDLGRIFMTKTAEGKFLIAEKFRLFEQMGARGIDEKQIIQFFEHGGRVTLFNQEVNMDEAIKILEKKDADGELDEAGRKLLREFREDLWATKMAGELWSITGRAGLHNVQINRLGDFFTGRIMNLTSFLEKTSGFAMDTRGLWAGAYQPDGNFDLGFRDFFSRILSEWDESEINQFLVQSGGVERDERRRLTSLENMRLEDGGFWKKLVEKGTKKEEHSNFCKSLNDANESVKALLGPNGFFAKPSIEKFLDLKSLFIHLKEEERKNDFFPRFVERYVCWMVRDRGARIVDEEILTNHLGMALLLINSARRENMIDEEKRQELIRRYIGRLPHLRVWLNGIWGVLVRNRELARENLERWLTADLWELIRSALRYIFET